MSGERKRVHIPFVVYGAVRQGDSPPLVQQALDQALDHHRRGNLQDAERGYRRVLMQESHQPDALHLLGAVALQTGYLNEAIELIEAAIAQRPDWGLYYATIVMAYLAAGRLEEARSFGRRAFEVRRDDPNELYALATALSDAGEQELAAICSRRAIELNPRHVGAWAALSSVCNRAGRYEESLAAARSGLALSPWVPELHWNLALVSLMLGDYQTGWRECEWRLQCSHMSQVHRPFTVPRWDHHDLAGKTILLHCEGGFGESIQFARYVPLVAQRAGRVLLECPAELLPLFRNIPGPAAVIARGEALPPFDYHCSLVSLPFNSDTRLDTIPAQIPYLKVDAALRDRWAKRIKAAAGARGTSAKRVGLVWSGSSVVGDLRKCELTALAPLAAAENVTFFSLQVGPDSAAAKNPPDGMSLIDLSGDIRNFGDTAAILENLDLLISIDTSVAHLAGALGRPVWTLIFIDDFRWMLEREDSPWYPTMRLFRQKAPGEAILRAAQALRDFA